MEKNYFIRKIDNLVCDLPHVTRMPMFGAIAWFCKGNIFALLLDGKRVAGRFLEPETQEEYMKIPGSGPLAPGGKPMKYWVVMSEEFTKDEESVEELLEKAHTSHSHLPEKLHKKRAEPISR